VHERPDIELTVGGVPLVFTYVTHAKTTLVAGEMIAVVIELAAAGWPVVSEATVSAGVTETAELFVPSVPVHEFCFGVTLYFHGPTGTFVSVQLSPEIVPEHADPIVWRTPDAP
jgi:hypothetical protein